MRDEAIAYRVTFCPECAADSEIARGLPLEAIDETDFLWSRGLGAASTHGANVGDLCAACRAVLAEDGAWYSPAELVASPELFTFIACASCGFEEQRLTSNLEPDAEAQPCPCCRAVGTRDRRADSISDPPACPGARLRSVRAARPASRRGCWAQRRGWAHASPQG